MEHFVGIVPAERQADFNNDGVINAKDLAELLGAWGPCEVQPTECFANLNCDDAVDSSDLAIVLGAWGPAP